MGRDDMLREVQKGGAMKTLLFSALLLVCLCVSMLGLACSEQEVMEEDTPPSLASGEVCSLVYQYLDQHIRTFVGYREVLVASEDSLQAEYIGNHQWSVAGLGLTGPAAADSSPTSGEWLVYEATGVVEPANQQARNVTIFWFE
jgi:hypothetical protein